MKEKTYTEMIAEGWEMTADGFWIKENNGKKTYTLQVEHDPVNDDYFITFPPEVLTSLDLKEGDEVEWVDQDDGSFLLKKYVKSDELHSERAPLLQQTTGENNQGSSGTISE